MRIGILTHVKHPVRQPFAGGLEAFTYDITLQLRERGHGVTLFASSASAPELEVVPILDDGNYGTDGCRRKRNVLSSEYLDEHHGYLDCMQRIDSHGFDVIFNNALHYVPVTMSGLIRTPMLTVLHTPPFFELINAIGELHKRGGGHYCTVSQANADNWAHLAPACHVIPNGIDLDAWRPRSTPIGDHALWFGRLVPDKGPHLALDAARAAGVPLRLAGQATDERYFRQEIAPRLGDQAVYLGHLDRTALAAEVAQARACLVTPCWDEPFGLIVAEALACGTPVAAFARGALPELLTAETGALAPPGDVPALAAALREALSLSREACRARAEAQWSHRLMIDRYERLLADVAAGRVARG